MELEPPLAEALRDAVAAELQAAGLVLAEARSQADKALSVVVNSAGVRIVTDASPLVLQRAVIALTASLTDAAGGSLGRQAIQASAEMRRLGLVSITHSMIMNNALADAAAKVRGFCVQSKAAPAPAVPAVKEKAAVPASPAAAPEAPAKVYTPDRNWDSQLLP